MASLIVTELAATSSVIFLQAFWSCHLEQSQPTPLSFSAGDLTVRAREDRTGDACARSLQSQAERLMEPYVQDGCFAFLEVEG